MQLTAAAGTNPVRAETGWPPVVVAGAYITGIVLMRNLARRGLSVSCVDCNAGQPAFRTTYGKTFLCPNPDTDPDAWVKFMSELAEQLGGKAVLISTADQFVSAIAAHADALRKYYIFPESVAVQGLLATKQQQYDIAGQHGLPVPRTEVIQSIEGLRAFAEKARFPCLIKPGHFRDWEKLAPGHRLLNEKVAIAADANQLESDYQSVMSVTPEVVLQEIIEGPDAAKLVYLACYGTSGNLLGSCLVRQVRTNPIHFGSASVVEPVFDPNTEGVCDRFLRSVGYTGVCELELKRDTRDGIVKLIEANPRYSVTADAAPYAGVDLGWLHYLDLIGIQVQPVAASRRIFRHVFLERDFNCLRSYRREGLLSWKDLIDSYRPPVAFFDFDLRDWRVTSKHSLKLFRIVVGPTIRRIIGRRN